MIINFHPKEIESKTGKIIIDQLVKTTGDIVINIDDKSTVEWQQIIKSDEKLVFVGPVYWWGVGHNMEEWFQNVLSYGFAYSYTNGQKDMLLIDRHFELNLTHGTPTAFADVLKKNIIERMNIGVFGFCGATVDIIFHEQIR